LSEPPPFGFLDDLCKAASEDVGALDALGRHALEEAERLGCRYELTNEVELLRALATAILRATNVVAGKIEGHARPDWLPALVSGGRIWFRLAEQRGPAVDAERILGERSVLARDILSFVGQADVMPATELRKRLGAKRARPQQQSNVARVIKRLVAAGLITVDRARDGSTYYGVTQRGRSVAEELEDTLGPPDSLPKVPAAASSTARPSTSAAARWRPGLETRLYPPVGPGGDPVVD
jgi:DNA-binding MarR family transcriptional regulator